MRNFARFPAEHCHAVPTCALATDETRARMINAERLRPSERRTRRCLRQRSDARVTCLPQRKRPPKRKWHCSRVPEGARAVSPPLSPNLLSRKISICRVSGEFNRYNGTSFGACSGKWRKNNGSGGAIVSRSTHHYAQSSEKDRCPGGNHLLIPSPVPAGKFRAPTYLRFPPMPGSVYGLCRTRAHCL